ncbi:MAG: spore coat polysaccharide biosynthesis predicted glycosyltransferase SpsG [Chlamydiales bacterium]|jgi:spore coat polysaccharide biosynthesis predicted glycosyltransferase SpsG
MAKIYVHCNGNDTVGLGHFFRCFYLCKALRNFNPKHQIFFVGNFSSMPTEKLQQNSFSIIPLDTTDATLLVNQSPKADAVIIDCYRIDQKFIDYMNQCPFTTIYFDDFGKLDFSKAGTIINFRVGAERLFNYHSSNELKGAKFFPVTPELQLIRKQKLCKKVQAIQNILVCLGGSDLYNVGHTLAQTASEVFQDAQVTLLSNQAPPQKKHFPNPSLVNVLPLTQHIERFLKKADLLITGGGMLKYESAYCGIPNATLSQTKDQRKDTLVLASKKLTLDLGLAENFTPVKISQQLKKFENRQFIKEFSVQSSSEFSTNSSEILAEHINLHILNTFKN